VAKRSGYTKRDIQKINVMVGVNLKAARDNAGMKQWEVMEKVWGVKNKNCNRICEIERGDKSLTLVDLLIFQRLYGQSLDYICGLSTEPEIDMIAGTVNHVVNQSHAMIEALTTQLANVMVEQVKAISKNDHAALLSQAKSLCAIIKTECSRGNASVAVIHSARETMRVIDVIDAKHSRQSKAVATQMTQITERLDDDHDRHSLIRDINKHYQYSLPLPSPNVIEDTDFVGVGYGQ